MRLDRFVEDPIGAGLYCERYVNDGSPSGFTHLYRPRGASDPLSPESSFELPLLLDQSEHIQDWGESSMPESILPRNAFPVHPDMITHPDLEGFDIEANTGLWVSPTSSGRTVQLLKPPGLFQLKLFYDGIIGRNNRRLYRTKAIAGPECSTILSEALGAGTLPPYTAILHEPSARLHLNSGLVPNDHWGCVVRHVTPQVHAESSIPPFQVPFFSLWSRDSRDPDNPPLLKELIDTWGATAEARLMHSVILPLVELHFTLVTKLGLQFEFNAQNVLLGLDANMSPSHLILRDMMDIEKDLPIRRSRHLSAEFESWPYHVIDDHDPKFYQQRHSFAFDFKLSGYVIEPLLKMGARLGILRYAAGREAVIEKVKEWLPRLPEAYFPSGGVWYSYEPVLVDREKIHVAHNNAPLRP